MGISFKFNPTPKIVFGIGKIKTLPEAIKEYGNRVLIVTGERSFIQSVTAFDFFADLEYLQIEIHIEKVQGEPSPELIDVIVLKYRNLMPDVIVSIGGGSVIDAGKAISAMLTVEGGIEEYLEDIAIRLHPGTKIPFIAVPTTAGTGSETTRNAVITQHLEPCYKKSLRHDHFVPNLALVDPLLTRYLSPHYTATTGMDAFSQLLEAYLSVNSNYMTDMLAIEGLKNLIPFIKISFRDGENGAARSAMSYASMLSGIVLSNAGLGLVHGLAQPLGCLFNIPHSEVCSMLIKPVNQATITKIFQNERSVTLKKYEVVGEIIDSNLSGFESINRLLTFIDELNKEFKTPSLSQYHVTESDFDQIIKQTNLKSHPVPFSVDELKEILNRAL